MNDPVTEAARRVGEVVAAVLGALGLHDREPQLRPLPVEADDARRRAARRRHR